MRGQKWTARGVTGALILFGAAGVAVGQAPSEAGKPAAIVNGEPIPRAALDLILKQNTPPAVAVPESVRKQHTYIALNSLINEVLMRQFLQKNAPPVEAKELDARMSDLLVGLKQQNKTLEDLCRETGQSPVQIKDRLGAILQWYAYAGKRITDADLEKYYRDNKDMFDKVQVRASEIMLRVPAQSDKTERERAKAQLTELRSKILSKEIDFIKAAKQYSQGPSRDQGGDLEWFYHLKGLLPFPDSVVDAAFALQPGQISEVLDSEYGVHLILVTDRKPGQPSELSKIKEEVRQLLMEEMQQQILRDLRQSAEKAGQIQVFLQ